MTAPLFRVLHVRPRTVHTMTAWFGLFAMAMLFAGPMLGQWRAVHYADQHQHQHQHQHHGHGATEHIAQHAASSALVGALVLDHCGYCHLATHFYALPSMGWVADTLLGITHPAASLDYLPPHAQPVFRRKAREPPLSS